MIRWLLMALFLASPGLADTLVAARTVRAHAVLSPIDLAVVERTIPGMLQRADEAIGMETRVALYAGRPIRPEDIGPPAIVERNQIVTLVYRQSGLTIAAEGRALGRAGAGDILRVMNLTSRTTVTGTVRPNGSVRVGGPDLSALN